MGIINNNKPKNENELLHPTPPEGGNSVDVKKETTSTEVTALQTEIEVLKEKIQKLTVEKEEQAKIYKDKLIEVYETQNGVKKDERTPLEKHIQNCIDFINKGKVRKNL